MRSADSGCENAAYPALVPMLTRDSGTRVFAAVQRDGRYLLVRYASVSPWRTEPWSLPGADVAPGSRADRAVREALWNALGIWARRVERHGRANSLGGKRVV